MTGPDEWTRTVARIAVATGWTLDQVRALTLDEATALVAAINEERS